MKVLNQKKKEKMKNNNLFMYIIYIFFNFYNTIKTEVI